MATIIPLPGDENAKADVMSGDYELHRKLREGDIVFDIGAHIGYFTELACDKVGPTGMVFAFEPDGRNFNVLVERLNPRGNVKCFRAAVCDISGYGTLFHNLGNSGAHSLHPYMDRYVSKEMVELLDLAEFIDIHGIPTFIKIDAERSEEAIIRSLLMCIDSLKDTHIVMELHDEQLAQAVKGLLSGKGWTIRPKDNTVGIWYADYVR